MADSRRIRRLAREVFGFDRLRDGQEEAVLSVASGRDTLAVLPTGHGKSAIYQLAALLIPGATVVVSPLIALQRDQVAALLANDVTAASANSHTSRSDRERAFTNFAEGSLEFLFLAPEQLANEEVLAEAAAARPSLMVVDEAHCISSWGHDFRPDYLALGSVADALGRPPILALTATAAPPVRAEIIERLHLREPHLVVRGFDRPNIHLEVVRCPDADEKRTALAERVVGARKPGIVYAASRRATEELAALLVERAVNAAAYHAGLAAAERHRTQDAFDAGQLDVVVATTAFGMGIDKPDVRFVYHHDPADSLDSYYQEIGRAGRDGEEAEAVLFYRPEDLGVRRFFASGGGVDPEDLELVAAAVARDGPDIDLEALAEDTGLSATRLAVVLRRLSEAGGDPARAQAAEGARRAVEQSRVEMMRSYAEAIGCRRQALLSYFGDPLDDGCGRCDRCDSGCTPADDGHQPFPVHARVRHISWGRGQVLSYAGDTMNVFFDDAGYRNLAVELVRGGNLLSAEDVAVPEGK